MSLLNVTEPIFDVAQLAHVELLTPNFDDTLRFFKDLLETERRGGSAYLQLCVATWNIYLAMPVLSRSGGWA
jgi:hypothetical protein